ncbi:hypothetical protein [Mucilaginibacter sp.]|uniref:hypothetical protein n=1 Tax=Mucilaginibacter sp. TaxID=1882438 RepID=UPI0035BBDD63
MKKLVLLTVIVITLASCKKEKVVVSEGVFGTWELRTIFGGWGQTQTFAPGKGDRYYFGVGNTYAKIKDGKEETKGTFNIKYSGEDRGYKYGLITFTNPAYSDAFSVKGDTINIGTNAADGPSYQFIRVK